MGSESGKFVWHELATTDPDGAQRFYSGLFGWTFSQSDMGEGPYHIAKVGNREVAGLMKAPPDVPCHWNAYATVGDVDASAREAKRLGGEVLVPPMDIPTIGRFALLKDPTGGCLNAFTGIGDASYDQPPATGHFCWNELLTPDPGAALPFYAKIFGWGTAEVDMGKMGVYHLFKRGQQDEAGLMKMPPGVEAPPHWLYYVSVENADATAKKVGSLGGTLYVEPSDIPDVGRFAVAADPAGAVFAILQLAR